MPNAWNDLRYALRQLRRAPGFAFAAIATLALAIGATTALVSILRATLLNPTAFPRVGELVSLQDKNLKGVPSNGIMALPRTAELHDLRDANGKPVFAALARWYLDMPALAANGKEPVSVSLAATSGDFFKALGTAPLLGRVFTPQDDVYGAPSVTVLSYGLWQRLFAGAPRAVGASVRINGELTTVIGVMPRAFQYPANVEVWKPARFSVATFGAYRGQGTRFWNVVAREQVPRKEAGQAIHLLAARLARAYPATDADWGFRVQPLRDNVLGEYRQALFLLGAAVGMLLLIACSNVAGLQLSRNAAREGEIAIRRMLGVGGARLLGQLAVESLTLFAIGGGLGVLLAGALLRGFTAALPPALLAFAQPALDRWTLLAMLVLTLLTGLMCGAAPVLQFGVRAPQQGRTVIANTRRFGQAFASAQTALALVLLALASVLLGQLSRLTRAPLGFEATRVLATSAHLPFGTAPAEVHRFYTELAGRFRALPGVESVGAIDALPFQTFSTPRYADIVGRPPTPHGDLTTAEGRTITPEYLQAMRIPLVAGRSFLPRDAEGKAPAVALVNQAFQRKYFPGESSVGRHLRDERGTVEIVGVVADTRGTNSAPDAPASPEVDQPEQGYWPDMQFVVRTALPAPALDRALRREAAALDAGVALGEVVPFTQRIDRVLAGPRLNTGLLSALAGLALVLVLTGVYGVVAFAAAQRTRELALRLALGAPRSAVFRMLLRESALVAAPGLLLGLVGAWVALRALPASSSQGSAVGPLALAAVLLGLAVALASTLPARRAALTDPAEVLKAE